MVEESKYEPLSKKANDKNDKPVSKASRSYSSLVQTTPTQPRLILINTKKCNRFNDCTCYLSSQHKLLCRGINEYYFLNSAPLVASRECTSQLEDMGGGAWFQIDLSNNRKLKRYLPAFKVRCCLFSKVKENIQENNRKPFYTSERILLDLIPLQHRLIIYMKAELTTPHTLKYMQWKEGGQMPLHSMFLS